MKNYISINGHKVELTEEQVKKLAEAYDIPRKQLSEYAEGSVVKIGGFEFVVLDRSLRRSWPRSLVGTISCSMRWILHLTMV